MEFLAIAIGTLGFSGFAYWFIDSLRYVMKQKPYDWVTLSEVDPSFGPYPVDVQWRRNRRTCVWEREDVNVSLIFFGEEGCAVRMKKQWNIVSPEQATAAQQKLEKTSNT